MIIVKSPLRISFLGGSTDYESFYKEHGSFIIGTTIDKYIWLSAKYRPKILPREHFIGYSRLEKVSSVESIKNPLIREILRYNNLRDYIDFHSSADVPSRTGLGGSSSFCVGMVHLIKQLEGKTIPKKELVRTGIHIERNILKESGGIQDLIWPVYGGLNTITIQKNGNFNVKPVPISEKFKRAFEDSIVLIYTNHQRKEGMIAKSHDKKDKKKILDLSKQGYEAFLKENIEEIGSLILESWREKRSLSPLISTPKIDAIAEKALKLGAYGVKLLGSGGSGFLMTICNPEAKKRVVKEFKDDILDFKFENQGISVIHT